MKKIAIALAAVLIVGLVGGWYWFSPQITLFRLHDAAEAGDGEAVMSYIDLPALKASLKQEAKHALVDQAREGTDSNIGIGLGSAIVDMAVDRFVTEENIAAVVTDPSVVSTAVNPYADIATEAPESPDEVNFTIQRSGLNEFRLIPDSGDGGALIFRRDGLGWKLSGVSLADSTF